MTQELMDTLAAPENLLLAWRTVRGNVPRYRRAVSAGPDQITLADYEHDLPAHLNVLRDMLLNGRYEPAAPKLISLPKADGGERTIGVLNVADRVAQRAATQVLSPIWEIDFLESSFGFRPGRGTPDAIAYIRRLQADGHVWVVEGDIENCFGSLDHDVMLRRVRARVEDGRIVRLIERWLDCGALQAGAPDDGPTPGEPDRWQTVRSRVQQGANLVLEGLLPGVTGPQHAGLGGNADLDPARIFNPDLLVEADLTRRWVGAAVAAGVGWLRPNIGRALYQSGQLLNTPAGRRLLRSSSWAVAGLAGAAALGAVTAWAMRRYAGAAPTGVLQGSPLSPLLANVYLHPFDRWMGKRQHRLVRYADDFVILASAEEKAEAGYNDALVGLNKLRLSVNRRKMRIVGPAEPWEFLGEAFGSTTWNNTRAHPAQPSSTGG